MKTPTAPRNKSPFRHSTSYNPEALQMMRASERSKVVDKGLTGLEGPIRSFTIQERKRSRSPYDDLREEKKKDPQHFCANKLCYRERESLKYAFCGKMCEREFYANNPTDHGSDSNEAKDGLAIRRSPSLRSSQSTVATRSSSSIKRRGREGSVSQIFRRNSAATTTSVGTCAVGCIKWSIGVSVATDV